MEYNKKVIVLKDMKSNIIDEAYVILRENVNIRKSRLEFDEKEFLKENFIYEEAEKEINDYVRRQEDKNICEENQRFLFLNKIFKILVIGLVIINIFLIK